MTMREELEEYASSVDADANSIENFDMKCCDVREVETLRNVFRWLDSFLKRHEDEDLALAKKFEQMDSDEIFHWVQNKLGGC